MDEQQKKKIADITWTGGTSSSLNPLDALPADAEVTISDAAMQMGRMHMNPTGTSADDGIAKMAAAALIIAREHMRHQDGNATPLDVITLLERTRDEFKKTFNL